jgi:hypothetical protein
MRADGHKHSGGAVAALHPLSGAERPDTPAQFPLPRGGYRAAPLSVDSRGRSSLQAPGQLAPRADLPPSARGTFSQARHPALVAHALRIAAERLA